MPPTRDPLHTQFDAVPRDPVSGPATSGQSDWPHDRRASGLSEVPPCSGGVASPAGGHSRHRGSRKKHEVDPWPKGPGISWDGPAEREWGRAGVSTAIRRSWARPRTGHDRHPGGRAAAGRGRVALLLGEAGIGKTSLAEAADGWRASAGFAVAWGRCPAADTPPYWPWTQVLSGLDLDAEPPGAGALRLPARVVRGRRGGDRGPLPASGGVLVVLEDLHWADAGSPRPAGVRRRDRSPASGCCCWPPPGSTRSTPCPGSPAQGYDDLELVGPRPGRHSAACGADRRCGPPTTTSPRSIGAPAATRSSPPRSPGCRPAAGGRPASPAPFRRRCARCSSTGWRGCPRSRSSCCSWPACSARRPGPARAGVRAVGRRRARRLLAEPADARTRGGRLVRARPAARDALPGTERRPAGRAAPAGRRAPPGRGSGRAGPALVAGCRRATPGRAARASLSWPGDLAAAGLAYEQAVGHYRLALELGAGELRCSCRLGEAQVQAGQIADGRETLRRGRADGPGRRGRGGPRPRGAGDGWRDRWLRGRPVRRRTRPRCSTTRCGCCPPATARCAPPCSPGCRWPAPAPRRPTSGPRSPRRLSRWPDGSATRSEVAALAGALRRAARVPTTCAGGSMRPTG